jgi:KUP system potassium uptake protein
LTTDATIESKMPDITESDNSGNGCKINPAALLTALGIVYGDIGTSPLYVYQAIKKATGQISKTAALGSLSLVSVAPALYSMY